MGLPVLPTASGEANGQPAHAFLAILQKEILWKKTPQDQIKQL